MIFARAIQKYGPDKFTFETLQDGLSVKEAIALEIKLIAKFKPEYNVSSGGKTPTSVPTSATQEIRRRIADRLRGRKLPPEVREKIAAASAQNCKQVICLDDGIVYSSVKQAAEAYGVSSCSIINVCRRDNNRSCHGKHFAYYLDVLTDADRNKILDEIDEQRQRSLAVRVKMRPVVCFSDGKRYPSTKIAAQAYGTTERTMRKLCQTGKEQRGRTFHYADQDAPVEFDKQKQTEWRRGIRLEAAKLIYRPVICLDNGVIYESVCKAEDAIGSSRGGIRSAIRRNGTCQGRRFVYHQAA